VVTRNKDRLVAKGYSQVEGLDFDETYVPVAPKVGLSVTSDTKTRPTVCSDDLGDRIAYESVSI
jgi:hypothetical protein